MTEKWRPAASTRPPLGEQEGAVDRAAPRPLVVGAVVLHGGMGEHDQRIRRESEHPPVKAPNFLPAHIGSAHRHIRVRAALGKVRAKQIGIVGPRSTVGLGEIVGGGMGSGVDHRRNLSLIQKMWESFGGFHLGCDRGRRRSVDGAGAVAARESI